MREARHPAVVRPGPEHRVEFGVKRDGSEGARGPRGLARVSVSTLAATATAKAACGDVIDQAPDHDSVENPHPPPDRVADANPAAGFDGKGTVVAQEPCQSCGDSVEVEQ